MNVIDKSGDFNYLGPLQAIEFPVKINIHFPIRGALYADCVDLNDRLMTITPSEVSFRPSSFHIPHITLYMGFATSLSRLQSVLERSHQFANDIPPLLLHVSKPYLKKPRRNWVFLDVDPADQIAALKGRLRDLLDGTLEPLSWDVVAEIPHITLAYVRTNLGLVDTLLESIEIPTTSRPEAVEVSFSGARGSCLGTIRTYELPARVSDTRTSQK